MTGQRVPVDKGRRRTYYGLAIGLVVIPGCTPRFHSIAPRDLAPIATATVAGWVAHYAPARRLRYDLRWRFQNDRGAAGGRAAVRVAPPDSLRFDFRGPFGKSGAAVVVGDSGIWAQPEGDFHDVFRAAPLFWAALGLPLGPQPQAEVFGADHPDRRAWRYALAPDTFDFVAIPGAPARLLAEMRREGKMVGLTETRFDASGRLSWARMDFPGAESRFTFTVVAIDSAEAFDPEIWRHP